MISCSRGRSLFLAFLLLTGSRLQAQPEWISGQVLQAKSLAPVSGASIRLSQGKEGVTSDSSGHFRIRAEERVSLWISAVGFRPLKVEWWKQSLPLRIHLIQQTLELDQVVVTGTRRPVRRSASPVPVELYSPSFFRKNPSPGLLESMQLINGIRPQINCNVCNTGDIHINGNEGPYTMVLIDGMPIVSSLSTVYGLSGIPMALVERVEVMKGPAGSLYGPEAIGGLINVITRNPLKAPKLSVDISGTSWKEGNLDAGFSTRLSKKIYALLGLSYFIFENPVDRNDDHFTDLTLQNRVSAFVKLQADRPKHRQASLAMRYFYEDRWGGELRWNKYFRGTDSVYGESIYTARWEAIGVYQLPVPEKLQFRYSFNNHVQRSAYGSRIFNAIQTVGFGEFSWEKTLGLHDFLAGTAIRYTGFDDDTPATFDSTRGVNRPAITWIPGLFVQDELELSAKHQLLLGMRWDHHPLHGSILTPRLAWKYKLDPLTDLRINAGTGFRVVNVFTEDHAALTGARDVLFRNRLQPEKSVNLSLNLTRRIYSDAFWLTLDASAWYTRFSNRIQPDYSDPQRIVYDNLAGHAVSKGVSLHSEFGFVSGWQGSVGFTLMKSYSVNKESNGTKTRSRPLLTESWSGKWTLSYLFGKGTWKADYTGIAYGPMLLPLGSPLDPRPYRSPVWSLQNIQLTRKLGPGWEVYAGIKNLLNWTPANKIPFLIARSGDPFNKEVEFDSSGAAIPTADNPFGLLFDTSYAFAPNQGIRGFLGLRLTLEPKEK